MGEENTCTDALIDLDQHWNVLEDEYEYDFNDFIHPIECEE